MSKKYTEITKAIVAYFEDDKDKEMLVQWRSRFELKIKEFHEELIRDLKRKLNEVIQQNNARKKLDNKKTEFENNLLQKSKEIAHQLKCTDADEEEIKGQFNTVWSHLVEDLTSNTKPFENIDLQKDQFVVLQDLGVEWFFINESKSSQKYKGLSEAGGYSHYITSKRSIGGCREKAKRYIFPTQEQEKIRLFIDEVEQQCLEAMKSKPVATRGYSSTYLQELAKHVKQRVTEFESGRKYTFKKEFTVDLSLYVFDRAESWLLQSHKTYKDNNDVFSYLDSKKKEYYNIFKSFCKGSSSVVVFGEMMCKNLKVSAVEAVCNKTGVDIAGEMMSSFPAFSGNRLNLEKHVLASLAENEDFNSFIIYIQNPRKQVEAFIKEEVEKYMFVTQKGKAQNVLNKNVEDITRLVSQALFEATDEVKKKKGDIEMWVEEFSSKLRPNLTLDTISCQNFSEINNFDFLKEEIDKGFKNITEDRSSLSLNKVNECRQKPEQILIDQLCNCCWERCPFCAAVCTNTLKDHSPDKHSVPFHRPSGVKGWHDRGTVDLVIDFCTTLVASDRKFYPEPDSKKTVPFKQYPTAGETYASWSITADASKLAYWKWFVCHFQKKLEDYYDLKFQGRGEIPQQWKHLSKEDAIESLNEMCSLR
ncbi:hypothetical protein AMECASPLE_020460 [Ameca splendens]|uniref:Interferon-induced very large GTPase 1 domain-containing protein n=1 Tax=Ameca splendens TaxID=208324 RepID=A0ABV0Z1C9_9TELE